MEREQTTQFNIRVSKQLVDDMDFIARHLNLGRNDWLKVRLAELIKQEKQAMIDEIQNHYVHGKIDSEEFKNLLGYNPIPGLKSLRNGAKAASKRYFSDTLKDIKKR